jgi:hypothetical protein
MIMTEAEILEQMTSNGARFWSVLQYWTSVCFAVLIAAHLTRGKVSGIVVGIFLIFYAGFSMLIFRMITLDIEMIRGGLTALEELTGSGNTLGPISHAALEHGPVRSPSRFSQVSIRLTLAGMFAFTLCYPVLCLFTSKEEEP